MNALVGMYGKCGEVENAHHLFDKMHVTDVVPCNAVLGVFARCGKDMESVRKMFNGMAMTPSTAQTNVDLEVKVLDEKDWNSSKKSNGNSGNSGNGGKIDWPSYDNKELMLLKNVRRLADKLWILLEVAEVAQQRVRHHTRS
ncbi:hypothetical protein QQ045_027995 [Rhodiola kirilowii]